MSMIPLSRRYPGLADVPRVDIAARPTPIDRSETLETMLGVSRLYVKREDVSSEPYGGNKIRKLEYLLGAARDQGRTATITFGAAGSNHALATAVYASREGFEHHSLLSPQPNASYVQKNLRFHLAQGLDIQYGAGFVDHEETVERLTTETHERDGVDPYVIPIGGTSPVGTLGPIDAAIEFAEQVVAGGLVEHDYVYVPLGSLGTAAGVAVGPAAGGHKSKGIAVRVTPVEWANHETLGRLVDETIALAREYDSTFPDISYEDLGVEIRDEFFGEGYACFTSPGMEAVAIAAEAGYTLEGTYTGKAFAALVADARAGRLTDASVAFWMTYNSHDLSSAIEGVSIEGLPEPLKAYFEEPVQKLDRTSEDIDQGDDAR